MIAGTRAMDSWVVLCRDTPSGRLYRGGIEGCVYAGSTREAIHTGSSTVNYLLGDHPSLALGTGLGSTAITTDVNGASIAEIRYYAWGTTRTILC
jgi:hypothetical protein